MGFRATSDRHDQILQQLSEERAAALVRISRKLDALIQELHAARQQLAAGTAGDREGALLAYRNLRKEALTYRWYLEVQREAIGLRHHHLLDQFYRIPDAVDAPEG